MSHVVVESSRLQKWCEQILESIEKSREERWHALAERIADQYNSSILRRFLHIAPKTVEQVLVELKSGDVDIDVSVLAVLNHGWKAEAIIRQLTAAAHVAAQVVVSVDDIQALSPFAEHSLGAAVVLGQEVA